MVTKRSRRYRAGYRTRTILARLILAVNGLLLLILLLTGGWSLFVIDEFLLSLLYILVIVALPVGALTLTIGGTHWFARILCMISILVQGAGLLTYHNITTSIDDHRERGLSAVGLMIYIVVPLASLLNCAGAVASLAFTPRIKPGHCFRCGYNLRGLIETRCPECGTPFDRLWASRSE